MNNPPAPSSPQSPENSPVHSNTTDPVPRGQQHIAKGHNDPVASSLASSPEKEPVVEKRDERDACFVVGIGASAGGLESLSRFFANMPADCGMAFVVIQHLSPDYRSYMVELLSKRTYLQVTQAEDGQVVEPNKVYILPPNNEMTIADHKLTLRKLEPQRARNMPIDRFFLSLGDDCGKRAIGIILSGTGSDGAMGIRRIKENGGLVLVESLESAQFDGMPRAAIASGLSDFVIKPQEMPAKILLYIDHPYARQEDPSKETFKDDETYLSEIFEILRNQCGTDFSGYKPSTIERRIERRMVVNQIHSLEAYVDHLQKSPPEAESLFNDLLISVTRFFRDRDAFTCLEETVIPKLIQQANQERGIRVWVPGCATGEEAYSIAMLLAEAMEHSGKLREIKVFASDISRRALDFSSTGIYSENAVAALPEEWLDKYFIQRPEGYQVSGILRKMVLFTRHDLLNNPPFTKIDLISCRNVLIYMQSDIQERLLSLFQYCLKPDGFLFLGGSESLGENVRNFRIFNLRHKIYQPQIYTSGERQNELFMNLRQRQAMDGTGKLAQRKPPAGEDFDTKAAMKVVLDTYKSCLILVDDKNHIVQSFGQTEGLLRIPSGTFSTDLLKLVPDTLHHALSAAFRRLSPETRSVVLDNIKLPPDEGGKLLRLHVFSSEPTEFETQPGRKVIIEEKEVGEDRWKTEPDLDFEIDDALRAKMNEMERELDFTKESLQATIEELETTNEELQATNEELLASNEELQSVNEELQSVNEELHTVNAENQERIVALTELSNDIDNILTISSVSVMLTDENLRIKRVSSEMNQMAGIERRDEGAPIDLLSRKLSCHEISTMAEQTLRWGESMEKELFTPGNRALLMRLAPYRVETGDTKGVVVTLIDITDNKMAVALRESEEKFRLLIDNVPGHALYLLDTKGVLTSWNAGARRMTGFEAQEVIGRHFSLFYTPDDIRKGKPERHLKQAHETPDFETVGWRRRKDGSLFRARVRIIPLKDQEGNLRGYSKIIRDITQLEDDTQSVITNAELLLSFINNAVFPLFMLDPEDRFLLVNEPLMAFLNLDNPAQIIGKGIMEIDCENRKIVDLLNENCNAIRNNQQTARKCLTICLANGKKKNYIITQFPLLDAMGELQTTGGIVHNLSEGTETNANGE